MPENALPEEARRQAAGQVRAGRKIEAIKIIREATGTGLRDAKQTVERMAEEILQREGPGAIAPSRGCALLVALVGVAMILASRI